MALRPQFNFARLLEDLADVAILCTYSGVSALGDGLTVEGARIAAARQVWIGLGHLISLDPRFIF